MPSGILLDYIFEPEKREISKKKKVEIKKFIIVCFSLGLVTFSFVLKEMENHFCFKESCGK